MKTFLLALIFAGFPLVSSAMPIDAQAPPSLVLVTNPSDNPVNVTGIVTVNSLPNNTGQFPMAQSVSVAIASDQSTIPISNTDLPPGAATDATLSAINATISSFQSANHTDLVQVDTDLLANNAIAAAFQSANHTDLSQVDTDILAFKSANHTDLNQINTTLGSPFQAGGSIGNASFGISGTLPGFASTPTVNLGTIGAAATDAELVAINGTLGSPMQNSGGSVTANAGTNLNTSALNLETTQSSFKSANHTDLNQINTTLGTPMQNSGGSVTVNAGTNLNTSALNLETTQSAFKTANHNDFTTLFGVLPASLGQKAMANSFPIAVASDQLAVLTKYNPGTMELFGTLTSSQRVLHINQPFFTGTLSNLVTLTVAGTGAGSIANGEATFSTGTTTASSSKGVSLTSTRYQSGQEIFAMFTAAFTSPVAGTTQRIGLYDANNGFFIGYSGTTFGVSLRTGAADTTVNAGSWNIDNLTGAAGSRFTSAGSPVAIDLTKLNVYRIRFGWLGAAPIYYEVLSPDGDWVTFHVNRYPNSSSLPSIQNPNLPVTVEVSNGATTSNISIATACWGAGGAGGELVWSPKHVAGAATTVVKYSPGVLHSVCQNSQAGTTTVYDNTAGSGTIIAAINTASSPSCLVYDAYFSTGLTVVTTNASNDITVNYQ